MADTAYGLVLPFDTDDEEFVRGFQLGMLWRSLELTGHAHGLAYARAAEMVMRMAEAKNLPFTAQITGDWAEVTIGVAEIGEDDGDS
ncbi:hypothetical protein [Streptosporangium jomthongense]|uniref:Uncharacterized protein n=1 Tax=Streptosporangium jomthongense TaxID=1193683 RepID=A0ABV8FCT3_9ACTN